MRAIDANRLLEERRIHTYYHLPNGDIAIPLIDIKNAPTIEPEIVRCKDCKNRGDDDCPMRFIEWVEYDYDGYIEYDDIIHDYTKDDGFCDRAERKNNV